MSATHDNSDDPKYVGAKIEREKEAQVRMRAAQLGFDNKSEYFRALIDEDLEDAELPLE